MKATFCLTMALAAAAAFADTNLDLGDWKADFRAADAVLTLTHPASGARVSGKLAFAGPKRATDSGTAANGETFAWKICDARDGAKSRLALVAPDDNVQGYLTFQKAGDRVSLLVYHRTALAYEGVLTFTGDIAYRADAFACNLTPRPEDRVLSLKSGDADSLSNDSLFSAEKDEALRVRAGNKTIVSKAGGGWEFAVTSLITDPSSCEIGFEIERDYYRSRWVPYYSPIDRKRCPRPPTGWMSWNIYFDQAGSKENLAEARLGAKYLKPFGLEIWSIESWQGNSPKLPVSQFYNMNLEHYEVQFPEGMKWLADEIRKLGFKPGLWMAPFGTGSAEFYNQHKDWFLHRDGKPVGCWNGKYTLDPTVKAARDHLQNIFDTASHDWGYEFFKIDGMSGRGPGYCAHMYERPDVKCLFKDPSCPNPFELCVKAFRDGIGDDRIFLACQGHFTGAEAAYADASRTGADIVHPNQPVKWANLMLQARCTINQNFANSIVFWSDPDCMMISDKALADEQARVETTIVALPGQQMFAGDKLGELAPRRIRMLQQSLPVADVRPVDLYPKFGHLPVWDLSIKRPFGSWHVVALFNWGDAPAKIGFTWAEIGEPIARRFAAWEFWTDTYQGEVTESFGMEIPPRAVRLVALQPLAGRPQFLTSDRHITQGSVELKDQKWADGKLVTTLNVIGGFPMTARYLIPDGFTFKGVSAAGAKAETKVEAGGKVLAVTLAAEATKDVTVTLQF